MDADGNDVIPPFENREGWGTQFLGTTERVGHPPDERGSLRIPTLAKPARAGHPYLAYVEKVGHPPIPRAIMGTRTCRVTCNNKAAPVITKHILLILS